MTLDPDPLDAWACDWEPDDLNPSPDCPYCAGQMCARFDGLGCTHDRIERHGYPPPDPPRSPAILVYLLLAVIVACVVAGVWVWTR